MVEIFMTLLKKCLLVTACYQDSTHLAVLLWSLSDSFGLIFNTVTSNTYLEFTFNYLHIKSLNGEKTLFSEIEDFFVIKE